MLCAKSISDIIMIRHLNVYTFNFISVSESGIILHAFLIKFQEICIYHFS